MGVVGGFALLSEHGKLTAAGLAVEFELTVTGRLSSLAIKLSICCEAVAKIR